MKIEDYDLSSIAPQFREQTRLRLIAIETFLKFRGRKAAEQHAASLGIHVSRFYKLVRAWQAEHLIADIVPNSRTHVRRSTLCSDQQTFINQTIAANKGLALARLTDLVYIQAQRCGFELPDAAIVRRYILKVTCGELEHNPTG